MEPSLVPKPESRKFPKASLGSRFSASVIDGIIGFVVFCAATAPMVYDLVSKTAERQKHPGQPMTPMSDWILFGFFAICAAWVLSKDAFWPGQSFGKRFSRIVIASVKFNAPASRLRCIWRQFIFIAILVALELLGVGLFSERRLAETAPRVFAAIYILLECCLVLVTSEGRRVIDFIAGTQVVNGAELNEKQVT